MKAVTDVGIAEAIRNLRREMAMAMEEGQSQGLHFTVENIELEMSIEIERAGGADGKVSFKVIGPGVDVGAHGTVNHAASHRLKLNLKACGPSGPIEIRDDSAQKPQ